MASARRANMPEPEVTEPEAPAAAPEPVKAAKGEELFIVREQIRGARNGVVWPQPGEPISLPADEGEQYMRLGLVVRPDED